MPDITTEFRAGLARGELLLQACLSCARLNMYPRYRCPHCQSANLGWQKADGHGTLHSFTVLRLGAPTGFEDQLPYALGVVKLTEGVQLLARLHPDAGGDWQSYACDAAVEFAPASFTAASQPPCAWFRLPSGGKR